MTDKEKEDLGDEADGKRAFAINEVTQFCEKANKACQAVIDLDDEALSGLQTKDFELFLLLSSLKAQAEAIKRLYF